AAIAPLEWPTKIVFSSAFNSSNKKGNQYDALAKSLSGNSSQTTFNPAISNSSLTLGNQLSLGVPPPLPGIKIILLFIRLTSMVDFVIEIFLGLVCVI